MKLSCWEIRNDQWCHGNRYSLWLKQLTSFPVVVNTAENYRYYYYYYY